MIGVLTAAFAIAAAVWLLGDVFGFGTDALPAPQATLMKTVIEGVLGGNLPWGLVLIGGSFAIMAELVGVPSLPFAVGIYLPLSTMTPIFVGGYLRHFLEKSAGKNEKLKTDKKEKGILLGSGFIAGEGIAMVGVAIYAFIAKAKPQGIGLISTPYADWIALAAFLGLVLYIIKKTSK